MKGVAEDILLFALGAAMRWGRKFILEIFGGLLLFIMGGLVYIAVWAMVGSAW